MGNYRLEIKWGIIFTLVALLWMVLEKMLGWHDIHIDKHATYTNYFGIVAFILFIGAFLDKRKTDLGGRMNFKQGLKAGVIISIIIAVLSPIAQWITHTIITPEYFSTAIDHAIKTGAMDQAGAEAYFNLKNYVLVSAFGGLVMGLVTSAILALIFHFVDKGKVEQI